MRADILAASVAAVIVLFGCGDRSSDTRTSGASSSSKVDVVLDLISGSENEAVLSRLDDHGKVVKNGDFPASSDLVAAWERANNARIQVTYKGSIDIMHSIEAGKEGEFDAVWPASSMIIALGNEA